MRPRMTAVARGRARPMVRRLSRVKLTPTCSPMTRKAALSTGPGTSAPRPTPDRSTTAAATIGPSSVTTGSRTSRPAARPTAEQPTVNSSPAGQAEPAASATGPFPSAEAPYATVATTGMRTTIRSTRRYCRTATIRWSAPRSWAMAMIPEAPPAIIENAVVTGLISGRTRSRSPATRLSARVAVVTSRTGSQSVATARRVSRSTSAPMATPMTA
jgi:hypothetical protein